MPRVHARGGAALHVLIRQLRRQEPAAHAFQPGEFFIFVRRNEIARQRAIARNRNRPALRLQLVAPEVAANSAAGMVLDIASAHIFNKEAIRTSRKQCKARNLRD